MNFTMLCNCLRTSSCCAIVVMRCCWGIVPAIVCEFHHVVQLFVNFIMLCNIGHEVLLRYCISNCLWISPCCAIVCEFHHVVQLFVYFIMLCYCLCISSCCAIVCAFHHVVMSLNEEYFLTMSLTHWPTEPFPELLPQLKSAPKNLLYLRYTTCDEMIKKGPCHVWLTS